MFSRGSPVLSLMTVPLMEPPRVSAASIGEVLFFRVTETVPAESKSGWSSYHSPRYPPSPQSRNWTL